MKPIYITIDNKPAHFLNVRNSLVSVSKHYITRFIDEFDNLSGARPKQG